MQETILIKIYSHFVLQDNLQILRDLSLLQIQMRDLEGYRVRLLAFLPFKYSLNDIHVYLYHGGGGQEVRKFQMRIEFRILGNGEQLLDIGLK